ncbi:MAG TPA: ABC transporter ATP-binding protein [Candidatus Saccharibacteria bacterium]|nr:ABC transporter ATP-binding protein [Candidatus Saccharibacteria bacterium]HRQ97739.1 ABC transporter ATP-binding protein [Candidatus Saccharibacteria bacterium]
MVNLQDLAISISRMNKSFKLPHEKHSTLKSAVVNFRKRGYEKQNVLDNFSLDVKKGDFLGILGRNGSGKSTLLKTISGIYTPDSGSIKINGKLTPFIELGVGFNPELSGRDNVFLNGALLGFNRKEMELMYSDIVAFAELERFMDQKLKNYSSGMQVRLAFSIAIRADTDILVLDEVLAVGDEAFQRKCYDYFDKLKIDNKTVILVTHDMGAVRRFCSRAIVIDNGKIIYDGDTDGAAETYRDLNLKSTERFLEKANKKRFLESQKGKKSIITSINTVDKNGDSKVLFAPNEQIFINCRLNINEHITRPYVQIWFSNPGSLAIARLRVDSETIRKSRIDPTKEFDIEWIVDGIYNDGKYIISAEVDDESVDGIGAVEVLDDGAEFIVSGWDAPNVLIHPKKNFKIKQS